MRTIVQDLISIFRSKVIIIFAGLLTAVIVARSLGPEMNGILASILVYPSLFITFGALGVRKSSAFLIGRKMADEEVVFKSIIHLWIFSSIFSVLVSFGLVYFTLANKPSLELIMLSILPIPFSLLNTYLSGVFLGNNQIKEFNEVNWIPNVTTLIFTYFLVYVLKLELVGVLLAQTFGQGVMSGILFWKIGASKLFSFKFDLVVIKSILKLGIAYAIGLLIVNMNYRFDVIILEQISTPFETGIYSKGSVLTQYLWQIPMLLGTIVFARSASATDKRSYSLKVCQLLRLSLLVIVSCSLILILLAKPIILLLFGDAFLASVDVLKMLMPGVALLTIFIVLNMDISGQGKPLFLVKSLLPALIGNIILNILLIPKYGALGAAFSSSITYTLGAILFVWHYSRFTKIKLTEILFYKKEDFMLILGVLKKYKIIPTK
ncbi:MAG: polysaccharide biosynthesis C-terminal domain-containing protein [Algoriphagus sp.]|uniref:oligosaccharide flippase family protein n=1 Tax=Algoriphagus sp. TaxID=1872435 RepID=UPI002632BC74|nr:polysaccharide biosynthesis C-terminal domain-containing protein [Algoriphagus sp.]MDG1279038.1 polysaccharide biosynthesis C-terminal domain-containing protein [Algoriphagus sp.]